MSSKISGVLFLLCPANMVSDWWMHARHFRTLPGFSPFRIPWRKCWLLIGQSTGASTQCLYLGSKAEVVLNSCKLFLHKYRLTSLFLSQFSMNFRLNCTESALIFGLKWLLNSLSITQWHHWPGREWRLPECHNILWPKSLSTASYLAALSWAKNTLAQKTKSTSLIFVFTYLKAALIYSKPSFIGSPDL